MSPRPSAWPFGIRARIVTLALVPLLAIALVIGGYTVHVRLGDARQALDERGRVIAANLAMAAELALLTRDWERLAALCEATLRQPDVVWVAVVSADGALRAEAGSVTGQGAGLFRAPMGTSTVQITDFEGETAPPGPPEPLGWAEVRLSLEGTLARQRHIQVTSFAIIGGGLLLSLLAALRLGAGISRPLIALSDAMTRYRKGDQTVRVGTDARDEIGELARDFNRMADALTRSQALLRAQISSATEELQQTVETLSAKNAELEAAREDALRAGEEKYEFLARMSHEIRTPLNAVIGFSRLLHEDAGGQGVREYTLTIDRAANQLLTVIDGILNFTKLESGSLELERLPFDLRGCLEDAVTMLSPAAHEKGLELALVLHRDIPDTLVGDPSRIAQVLMNLLNNAIKFAAAGHVLVEAGYEAGAAGEGTIRVVVSDTGVGLAPAERHRLFQPFAQADSSVTRRYGGTGLGLVISKRLVDLMGGTIGVDSKPGRGSRFFFTIPCGPTPEHLPALDGGPLTGCKILVYDRHPIQLRALRTLLLGWSMEVFNTAQAELVPAMLASAVDRRRPFGLLILGLAAEEALGPACEGLLARVRGHYDGPILVLVGAECWTAPTGSWGRVDWAPKPVRRSLLYRCLCGLLHAGPMELAPAERPPGAPPSLVGRRVLVVEDNPFNRLLMRRLLELRGLEVAEAQDGSQAISATREADFDLIFMDIHMPGMDGVEVARRIRTQVRDGPCPPILALSADVFTRDRLPEDVPVFDGFLLKPVAVADLDAAMARVLGNEAGSAGEAVTARQPKTAQTPGPAALAPELAGRLRDEIAALTRRLEAAIEADDRPRVRELAHELKGLCGYFGKGELGAAVRELEAAATREHLDGLRARLEALKGLGHR